MVRPKSRKLHIDIDPPVEVEIGGRHVTFDGINLLRPHVMVEYRVDPPLDREWPFGPALLVVDVFDDTSEELYPTFWHDFEWRHLGPGRTTTRLERRPPATATRLHIVVRPAEKPSSQIPKETSNLPPVVEFDVDLPPNHALPWDYEAHA